MSKAVLLSLSLACVGCAYLDCPPSWREPPFKEQTMLDPLFLPPIDPYEYLPPIDSSMEDELNEQSREDEGLDDFSEEYE